MSASFSNYDNMVVINVIMQDSIPLRLILDSGIEGVIITDQELVKLWEPQCLRRFKLSAPGSSASMDACVTPLVKVNFEGMTPMFSNLVLLQEDIFSLESYIGAEVHGLIGMDKFKKMVVSIDYDKNYLRFTRPNVFRIPAKAEIIPLSINRGRPYMTARVELDNGEIRNLWLMIDSGANHPLMLETDSLDTYKPLKSLKTVIGRGLGGNINGEFIRSGWMMLGNFRLDNIITSFSSEYFAGNPAIRNFRNGTIGSGALSRFYVSFDYTNNRLILLKGTKYNKPFEYNMSGVNFESINTDFNIFRVNEVIFDSPGYHAGLKIGDILISINGRAAFTMNLGELNGILSSKSGATIHMTISREEQILNFKFKLRKLI